MNYLEIFDKVKAIAKIEYNKDIDIRIGETDKYEAENYGDYILVSPQLSEKLLFEILLHEIAHIPDLKGEANEKRFLNKFEKVKKKHPEWANDHLPIFWKELERLKKKYNDAK